MFGISFTELVAIFAVALLVYGPNELPAIARRIGRLAADFQRVSTSVRREFFNAMYTPAEHDVRAVKTELKALKHELSPAPGTEPHPPPGERAPGRADEESQR